MRSNEVRAEEPRIPAATRAQERAHDERKKYLQAREILEHRSVLRGLIMLALIVLLVSMMRAGLDRVFVHGWWRP